jgi:hypothetical protein
MEMHERTTLTVKKAAQQAGVDVTIVRHCIRVGVMDEHLTDDDLAELRRVRRLMSLGINLPGAEVILRLRRRIEELEAEIARLERRVRP